MSTIGLDRRPVTLEMVIEEHGEQRVSTMELQRPVSEMALELAQSQHWPWLVSARIVEGREPHGGDVTPGP